MRRSMPTCLVRFTTHFVELFSSSVYAVYHASVSTAFDRDAGIGRADWALRHEVHGRACHVARGQSGRRASSQ
jgi:hypothetical protein